MLQGLMQQSSMTVFVDGSSRALYNVIQEVAVMIALRLKEDDEKLIREYAKFNNISVSELMRQSVMAYIEEEYDLSVIREYEKRKKNDELEFVDHDEVWGKL